METLLSFMPYLMQGLSLLTSIITNSNQSSAKNTEGSGSETSTGSETTQGSLTAAQQIGATQIGTPTGISTFSNQSSVNTANALQMMSGLLSNLANAGSQASAKKYNSAEAAAERAFQKEMRGTAYQDTVKDMIAAGINPILAATNGATASTSGASASIGSQRYNQQSAEAASVSAMYEYGNNTAELADKWYQLSKQSASIKQYKAAKNWEQAASELATSSAKQASDYAYAASKLGKGLAGAGKKAKDAAKKAGKAAKDTGEKYKKYNQRVPIMPNMDTFNAYRGD
nr:MAG TPA: minor capsid protein [Microviridae sp.]